MKQPELPDIGDKMDVADYCLRVAEEVSRFKQQTINRDCRNVL